MADSQHHLRPTPQIIPPKDDKRRSERAAAFGERLIAKRLLRHRLSIIIEALLWIVTMAWLLYLAREIWIAFKFRGEWDARSTFEFALLAMLVWWPIIRVRIRYGYWMRDWDDAPPRG